MKANEKFEVQSNSLQLGPDLQPVLDMSQMFFMKQCGVFVFDLMAKTADDKKATNVATFVDDILCGFISRFKFETSVHGLENLCYFEFSVLQHEALYGGFGQ